MEKIGIVGCGIGRVGLICASPDIVEAIDDAMKEEVSQMDTPIPIIKRIDMEPTPHFYEPMYNHKRKPSRYGQ